MSLFVCSQCRAVDNTAVTNWADRISRKLPPLCSECDPKIGKWHGRFPKAEFTEADRAEVVNPPAPVNKPKFKQHPTLDDLNAFAAEQRELAAKLRAACRRSYDAEAGGRRLSRRATERTASKFAKIGEVGDGRDLIGTPTHLSRLKELAAQAAEAERGVSDIQRQIEASREGRQMEAYDYDLYLSEGLELPAHRRELYERNAYAEAHAGELLDACEEARDFLTALSVGAGHEPEVLKTLVVVSQTSE